MLTVACRDRPRSFPRLGHTHANTGVSILQIQVPQELHEEAESSKVQVDEGVSASGGQGDGGGERPRRHTCLRHTQTLEKYCPRVFMA